MAPKSSRRQDVPLPSDFVPAIDVLDEKRKPGDFINVIGVVQKALAPMLTKRSEWKTDLEIYDVSTQYDPELRLVYSLFHSDEHLLSTVKCGDIVVLLRVKVQAFGVRFSLLHNFQTSFFIFANDRMPSASADPTPALRAVQLQPKRQLTAEHLAYISFFFHAVDKERLPTDEEFQTIKIQSEQVKDKFSELKDVQDSRFCDLKVNVVKEPFDSGDKMTLWVSDFTENSRFYNHAFDLLARISPENQDGDEYGYMKKFEPGSATSASGWPGPFGQRSMQITCWGYHADVIRDQKVGIGSWVHLKNVQIKFGHNGGNLEGYLREDHNAREKVRIQPLDTGGNGQNLDPQLKTALRRKRDYEKERKNDLKGVAEAAHAGQKRKAANGTDGSSGSRPMNRTQKRAAKRQKEKEEREAADQKQDKSTSVAKEKLNPAIKFEDHDVRPSSVEEILAEKYLDIEVDDEKVTVATPFINASYRGNFSVVDFKPDRLQDFAVPSKVSDEFAALSDNEDNDSGPDMSGIESSAESQRDRKFEWRFAVKLEDAEVSSSESKKTFWALIDNQAAQYLTNLDAVDLSRDKATLEKLRETLFLLWGNLEEKKCQILDQQDEAAARARAGGPPDSSHVVQWTADASNGVSNLSFGCCILEYGVKVKEVDGSKADAGLGYRWKRMFRLERTRIVED